MISDAQKYGFDLTRKVFDPAEVQFTPGERSMIAWITTDTLDHEHDVVVSSGVDYTSVFLGDSPGRGNPAVLACHDQGRWPVGQCKWIKLKRNAGFTGLYAKTVLDDDPDAEVVWGKIRSGSLRGVSIGFKPPDDMRPGEWGPPTREELARRPDWAGAKRVIRRSVLLEYSICALPMNPRALVAAVNKGVHRPVFILMNHERCAMPDAITTNTNGDEMGMVTEGMHARCLNAGGCGIVTNIHKCGEHGGMTATPSAPVAELDLHEPGCAPTGLTKCFRIKDLVPFGEANSAADETSAKALAEGSGCAGGYMTKPTAQGDFGDDADDRTPTKLADLRRGDHVHIDGGGHKGFGQVVSVHKDGDFVPDTDQHVIGTEDHPAARVRRFQRRNDGYAKTNTYTAHPFEHLTKADPPKLSKGSDNPPRHSGSKSSLGPARAALPPLVPMTDDQVASARMHELLSSSALEMCVSEALDKRLGHV
jgi:hypothetical protein